jgi:molybdopterin/thiamine biosynthesis adenylyltransferase/nitroreductase
MYKANKKFIKMSDYPNQLKEVLDQNIIKIEQGKDTITPLFFRTSNKKESDDLLNLLENNPQIKVFDTLNSQLKELVKSQKPHLTLSQVEIENAIQNHLNGVDPANYGVWVYYPWSENLVHILDEKEFVELRTNRNRYKITAEESARLAGKKVGVIGLSVGQSVSLTLAIERTFGELRIADFDELELTNLNRLRSGVHNMGLKKTVIVAREIAELDPYLKVSCFSDGITEENLESFLLDNGKLDVLIDECDGMDIKLKCRIAAKKHQIPVLMEASDRGTVDVERFDLEPDRPLLHGYIQHLDISKYHLLKTNEDKLPYLLAFAGIETLSVRMKASAIEVGQSISTWPQLASAVTMGGGITADVCRRVLLDQFHQSGRYFIDLDELIGDPIEGKPSFNYQTEKLTSEIIKQYVALLPRDENAFVIEDNTIIDDLAQAAVLAPSPGNNQPWKWYFDRNRLILFHDIHRSESYGDFEHMASYMSFGTAIENIKLKASAHKLETAIQLFPLKNQGTHVPVAVFTFEKQENLQADELANYLSIRHTNRKKGDRSPLKTGVLEDLHQSIAGDEGINLKLITDQAIIHQIADLSGKAEKLRMFIPRGHFDLFEKEIRWTSENGDGPKEGLDIRTLDLDSKDAVGFRVIKDARAVKLVKEWKKGSALEKMTRDLMDTASAVGLITAPAFTPENCIATGQAFQRIWLTAAREGIAVQPVMATILHFTRLKEGNGIDMPLDIRDEFEELYKEFVPIFNLKKGEVPLFLFRLFNAAEPNVKSLRLDISDIFFTS